VKEQAPHIGLIGGCVAVIASLVGLNIIIVVLLAIGTVFLMMM